jgi:hypothetical protein
VRLNYLNTSAAAWITSIINSTSLFNRRWLYGRYENANEFDPQNNRRQGY